VAVAVLGSVTVLPALLAKLGRWVDRPRVPLLWRLSRRVGPGGISRRIPGAGMRPPNRAPVRSARAPGALAAPGPGRTERRRWSDHAAEEHPDRPGPEQDDRPLPVGGFVLHRRRAYDAGADARHGRGTARPGRRRCGRR